MSSDIDRDALVQLFFEESEEGLASMEEALVAIESGSAVGDGLKTLFRVAHTLKGNAASLGFAELAEVTHEVEGVLDRLRSGSLAMSRQVADLLLASVDTLRELLREARR